MPQPASLANSNALLPRRAQTARVADSCDRASGPAFNRLEGRVASIVTPAGAPSRPDALAAMSAVDLGPLWDHLGPDWQYILIPRLYIVESTKPISI